MDTKKDRALFEKWAESKGLNLFREYDQYYYMKTLGAWVLWDSLRRRGFDPSSVLMP